jgi:hypothetical protein
MDGHGHNAPLNEESNVLNERPIPEAALRDKNAVEMLRVWIAEKKLHCSLKIGMYREGMRMSEEKAWGTILADITRHIANAMEAAYGEDKLSTVRGVSAAYLQELGEPTSDAKGTFVEGDKGIEH